MLLGTHPIPARSPAEREGQNGKEMREGGRETEEEEGRGGWGVENGGISRLNEWGEEAEKKWETGS